MVFGQVVEARTLADGVEDVALDVVETATLVAEVVLEAVELADTLDDFD